MTIKTFFAKARRKILRALFGKNLYTSTDRADHIDYLIQSQVERINILETKLVEQNSQLIKQGKYTNRLSWYHAAKYTKESEYPKILFDWYREKTRKRLDLNNPQTFNEKIQWLKLYDSTPLKTHLADKFLVRDWIKEKIGEEYLIPLLGVYDSFDEIDFDSLPDKFVLKANHGSGWNIIVKDKLNFDKEKAKKKIDYWMGLNFGYFPGLQLQYKDIVPKIIAEQYLKDSSGHLPDYKFLCFHGEPKFVWVDIDRYGDHKRNIYDLEWNKQAVSYNYPIGGELSLPDNLDKMISLVKIICNGFPHVRVDIYSINNRIYFGELTFTSSNGTGKFEPEEWDLKLGNMIILSALKKNNAF